MAAAKQAEADAFKSEVADLDAKIIVLSGWRTGCLAHLVLISTNPITGRPMPLKFNFSSFFWQCQCLRKQTS